VWADGRRAYFLGRDGEPTSILLAVKGPKDPWPSK
jgi:hypothetical protein